MNVSEGGNRVRGADDGGKHERGGPAPPVLQAADPLDAQGSEADADDDARDGQPEGGPELPLQHMRIDVEAGLEEKWRYEREQQQMGVEVFEHADGNADRAVVALVPPSFEQEADEEHDHGVRQLDGLGQLAEHVGDGHSK